MVEEDKKKPKDPTEKEIILPPNIVKGKYPDVNNANLPKEWSPVKKRKL